MLRTTGKKGLAAGSRTQVRFRSPLTVCKLGNAIESNPLSGSMQGYASACACVLTATLPRCTVGNAPEGVVKRITGESGDAHEIIEASVGSPSESFCVTQLTPLGVPPAPGPS